MKDKTLSRRDFMGAAAAIGAFTVVPRHVLGGPNNTPPSEKINIAGVGIGGQGGHDIDQFKSQNIVALCDVDWQHAAGTFGRYPNAKKYKDFREMLDKEDKNIDGVVVGTPDHLHAIVSMAAIKRGKHVYCEKPLTHTVREAKLLADAAREAGVATQMGNQGQASEQTRLLCETIWDGISVRSTRCTSGRIARSTESTNGTGCRVWTGPKDKTPSPRPSTGTFGLARRRCVRMWGIEPTIHSSGVAGGTSAPAHWAISAVTAWTRRSAP